MLERRSRLVIDALLFEHDALRASTNASGEATCCVFADEIRALRLDLTRVNAAVRAAQDAFSEHERDELVCELRDLLDIVMEHA